MTKPFRSPELLAHIREQERIEVGPLVLEPVAMAVTLRGAPIELTANEFALVHALALRPGCPLDREQLLQLLHGTAEQAFDRSIDVVVSRVRAKLENDRKNPKLLKTVRGVGYMLAPAEL
jgi:DNA-binding response OmpR family regulator